MISKFTTSLNPLSLRLSFHPHIIDRMIIQVQFAPLVTLSGARITMTSRILDLLEFGIILQSERDKRRTPSVWTQGKMHCLCVRFDLRLDCLITHGSARGMIPSAEAHEKGII